MSDLNVGGGLGIRYVESDDPPSIEQWIQGGGRSRHQQHARSVGLELPRLMCEPGRSLVATSRCDPVYTVGSRKTIPNVRTYVAIDGGMSDNPGRSPTSRFTPAAWPTGPWPGRRKRERWWASTANQAMCC